MANIRLTSVKIQDNATLKGAMAEKGIDASQLSIARINIENNEEGQATHDRIHEIMRDALEPAIAAFEAASEGWDIPEGTAREAMINNINCFKLDAGTGYTMLRKKQLQEETDLVAADFVAPKKTGSGSSTASTTGNASF